MQRNNLILEITFALLLGITAGTITGLIPGIHINLIAVILLANLSNLTSFQPTVLAIFIVSMATTHTFIDFIPSVFLGAPEEDTFLSILPGHEMLKEGKAHEAIILTLYGSLFAFLVILFFTPIFIIFIPIIYPTIHLALPILLIFISSYLILREKYILTSLIVFLLSGFLGFSSLNIPINQPLIPLLTGLFGTSALIISLKDKPSIPPQNICKLKEVIPTKKDFFKSIFGASISAPLCSFLPGIGSGHAAVIGSELVEQSKKSFMMLLGAINTIVITLSFVTLFIINKTRTGSAVAINKLMPSLTQTDLITLLIFSFISGLIAFFIALFISKFFSSNINKINYRFLSITIIGFLTILTIFFTGIIGLLILIASTALGIFAIKSAIRRINLMGVLLIPTIIFYITSYF
ncbi:hypothetical protein COU60_01265 [Candidatus Pacearchaeota archaeon CG10_big_fil_rev_8_21_14_0_10_34_76]|nr:MAG: hypothetical protein COU60_01265 [Candidatus Pacearchaeota archaeon CG10_big_fil_rev_8_21_14_0_10_34_76]